jgi:hypothetical protein
MNIKGTNALVKYIPELNSTGVKLLHPKPPSYFLELGGLHLTKHYRAAQIYSRL